jgi:hypothetical protein
MLERIGIHTPLLFAPFGLGRASVPEVFPPFFYRTHKWIRDYFPPLLLYRPHQTTLVLDATFVQCLWKMFEYMPHYLADINRSRPLGCR